MAFGRRRGHHGCALRRRSPVDGRLLQGGCLPCRHDRQVHRLRHRLLQYRDLGLAFRRRLFLARRRRPRLRGVDADKPYGHICQRPDAYGGRESDIRLLGPSPLLERAVLAPGVRVRLEAGAEQGRSRRGGSHPRLPPSILPDPDPGDDSPPAPAHQHRQVPRNKELRHLPPQLPRGLHARGTVLDRHLRLRRPHHRHRFRPRRRSGLHGQSARFLRTPLPGDTAVVHRHGPDRSQPRMAQGHDGQDHSHGQPRLGVADRQVLHILLRPVRPHPFRRPRHGLGDRYGVQPDHLLPDGGRMGQRHDQQ